jgi:hypothetical protein
MHAKIVIKNETPKEKTVYLESTYNQKLRHFIKESRYLSSEVAVLSFRNHGNFFKKSRQLLQEITATSSRNHGNFLRKSRQ